MSYRESSAYKPFFSELIHFFKGWSACLKSIPAHVESLIAAAQEGLKGKPRKFYRAPCKSPDSPVVPVQGNLIGKTPWEGVCLVKFEILIDPTLNTAHPSPFVFENLLIRAEI